MKTIIKLAIISVLTSTTAIAQRSSTDVRTRLLFGFAAGANYANVYDVKGDAFVADPKLGLAAGMFVSIPFGKYFGIQPEFLYSQKGYRATGIVSGRPYEYTRTSTYFDIPLLFAFKPSEFFTLLAGPQYSYLLNQKDVFKNSSGSVEQDQEFENNNIRKNILCVAGGADLNFRHIVLRARAGWDLQTNNGDGTSANPRYKNVWYQGTIGYRFYRH